MTAVTGDDEAQLENETFMRSERSVWENPVRSSVIAGLMLLMSAMIGRAAEPAAGLAGFFKNHCVACHDADSKKGGLDLAAMAWNPNDRRTFERWVKVFDKVDRQEMPPPMEKERPDAATRETFLKPLRGELHAASLARQQSEGRLPINIPCAFHASHPTSPRESL